LNATLKEIDVATTRLDFGCIVLYSVSPEKPIRADYVSEDTVSMGASGKKYLELMNFDPKEILSEDEKQILISPDSILL
jgi:hypothetical protein